MFGMGMCVPYGLGREAAPAGLQEGCPLIQGKGICIGKRLC